MTPLLLLALLPALALAGPLSYYYTPSLYAHDDSAVEVPLTLEPALYDPAGAHYPFALRMAHHFHPASAPIADVFFGDEEGFLRRRRPSRRPNRKPVNWNHVAQSAADITHDVTNTVNQFQQPQPQLFAKTVFLHPADAAAADDISFPETFPLHPVVRTPVSGWWDDSLLHSYAF